MTVTTVAACEGYHVIGAGVIHGVAVTSTTTAARSGLTWSGVLVVVVGWMFGGVEYHETSKGTELSFKLCYLITATLFFPICPVFSVCSDII